MLDSNTTQAVMGLGNAIILDAMIKADSVLSSHKRASVSISGGADSDIMLDLFQRVRDGTGCDIKYVFYDNGFEYQATRDHLSYLEQTYGITIERIKTRTSIPTCVKIHGQPFVSKYVSAQIELLQKYGFLFEDEPYDVLRERYPQCISALKWWTNAYNGGASTFDIARNCLLKEFLVSSPPTFRISSKCCKCSKKEMSSAIIESNHSDLLCLGLRKAEGGVRSKNPNTTCYTQRDGDVDIYRPLYWFSNNDCSEYRSAFNIRRSDCYEKWGMTRTGCIGCPFNWNVFDDLKLIDQYEPSKSKAARIIFAESYEYTRQYHQYRHERKFGEKIESTRVLRRVFDLIGDDLEWSSS